MTQTAFSDRQPLPDGIITSLLTDIKESSRLWEPQWRGYLLT